MENPAEASAKLYMVASVPSRLTGWRGWRQQAHIMPSPSCASTGSNHRRHAWKPRSPAGGLTMRAGRAKYIESRRVKYPTSSGASSLP
eukprot:scaffold183929_cov30-Tisochrysis_lutea.AAC.5